MMRPPEPDPPKNVKTTVKIKEETNNNVLLEGAELESVEDYIEKVIHIRTKKVGYLIGTAGRTIRGFENNSGAKIDIMSPNSTDQETPVLLSGTAESVRNVLRMIMDLYHMNNFSSQLWQHLRNNEHKDNKDNNDWRALKVAVVQSEKLWSNKIIQFESFLPAAQRLLLLVVFQGER